MSIESIKNNPAKLVTAHARALRISPRKMRLVTNLVRGMPLSEALVQLEAAPKKASLMLIKLLRSAAANAQNNFSLKPENLVIKSLSCDMGKTMKRYFPRARGSAFTIRRKTSGVNVVLEEHKKLKSKAGAKRLAFFKKAASKTETPSIDSQEASNQKPQNLESKQPQKFKTGEQRKLNTALQKRRLFNRKSGE